MERNLKISNEAENACVLPFSTSTTWRFSPHVHSRLVKECPLQYWHNSENLDAK
jgi:hypothetical protein